jgi:hypothetical protein
MLHWLPSGRTRPNVPAHRDDWRCYTHAYSHGHAKSHCDGDAKSYCDGNADFDGNPDPDTGIVYIV